MIRIVRKFIILMWGFFLCASSTIFMLNSNLGLSPWDVFHEGLSNITGITIGQASIIVSLIVVIIGVLLGQKVGVGTILNMFVVGKMIDIINDSNIIPVADNFLSGVIMMIVGMAVMGYGCYLYISCGLGCGPRDGVMLALSKKINMSIKVIRGSIEIFVLIIGFILGGTVGVGTVITAIGLGYFMQYIFKLCKFDAVSVNHKSVFESFKLQSIK